MKPTGFWQGVRGDFQHLSRGRSKAKGLALALFNRGFKALVLYRLSRWCWLHRMPIVSAVLTRLAQFLYVVDISYRADLGPGITLVHCFGIVIGSNVRIQSDCCIFHGVTLGDRGSEWVQSDRADGHPIVGCGVMLGAGAKILGPIEIGQNCVVGANAVVLKDVPRDSIAAGVPARVVGQRPQMTNLLAPMTFS